jgi:hypothetical protein
MYQAKECPKYQVLIGMAQWAVTIGRLDIAFAVSSLSRFSAAPREHRLELACYLFGNLKKHPNRRIVVDSRPLLVDDDLRTTFIRITTPLPSRKTLPSLS